MALFGKKKAKKAEAGPLVVPASRNLERAIVRPVVSEKAAMLSEKNVYAFVVAKSATKIDVRDAVRKLWNVTPKKIRIVNRPPRQVFIRAKNRMGTESGMKKAYVELKEGDRIDLV